MPVQILCPNPDCDASYNVVETNLGKLGRCKKCGAKFPLVPPTRDRNPSASDTDLDSALKSPEPAPPESLGRYQILRLLGRGGMGSVYLALDTRLKRRVAVKVPHTSAFADRPEVRVRFFREAEAAARFHHPNFCPIYDIGEADGVPYLTMAFIEGRTLAASIEWGRGWPERRAAETVRQLAEALAELHRQGIVHRDLKPANIMVDARGSLILMDFGLARWYEDLDSTFTPTGAVLGTPAYMPPEQAEANLKAIGPRSDLYSLGVIFYELLTGRRPFEGSVTKVLRMIAFDEPPPPSAHRPGLDPRLEAVCLRAMAKKPEDRYASMDEFAGALDSFLKTPRDPVASLAPGPMDAVADPSSKPPSDADSSLGERRRSKQAATGRSRAAVAAALAAAVVLGVIVYVATEKGRVGIEVEPSVETAPPAPPVIYDSVETAPPAPPVIDEIPITNSLGMKLKLISAGEFQMGSDASDPYASDDEKVDGKKHQVRITRPFYLGTTEVTVGQFRRFVEGANYKTEAERDGKGGYGWDAAKSTFTQDPKYTWRSPGFPQGDDHPVVNVSWNDAVAFCEWLGREEGQIYRLPTEAEWEYACRAGQTTRYSSGNDPESLASVGNVADGTAKEIFPGWTWAIKARDGFVFTAPVGSFTPNSFGLYDMHGNVWEWCSDRYASDYYSKAPPADPLNSTGASGRVIRGGSWRGDPRGARSAYRDRDAPEDRSNYRGFRPARVR